MSRGIIFIWSEKELMSPLMDIMAAKGFSYIENFQIIHLSLDKGNHELHRTCTKQSKSKEHANVTSSSGTSSEAIKDDFLDNMDKLSPMLDGAKLIMEKDSQFFKKSKRILLMFRKVEIWHIVGKQ